MNMSAITISLSFLSLLLLCACGNRDDLLMSPDVPPEDAKRYLLKRKPTPATAPIAAPEVGDDDER